MTSPKKLLITVLCASLLAPALPVVSAQAAPFANPAVDASSSVDQIYYRRGGWGWGPGGIIGGLIAGTLVAAAITEGRARHDDVQCVRCATSRTSIRAPAPTSIATARSASAHIFVEYLALSSRTTTLQGAAPEARRFCFCSA